MKNATFFYTLTYQKQFHIKNSNWAIEYLLLGYQQDVTRDRYLLICTIDFYDLSNFYPTNYIKHFNHIVRDSLLFEFATLETYLQSSHFSE
jgi:hypothetical protein